MSKAEARELLAAEMAKYRDWSYGALRSFVEKPERTYDTVVPSGARFQIGVVMEWDSKLEGDVRVTVTVHDMTKTTSVGIAGRLIKGADETTAGHDEEPDWGVVVYHGRYEIALVLASLLDSSGIRVIVQDLKRGDSVMVARSDLERAMPLVEDFLANARLQCG